VLTNEPKIPEAVRMKDLIHINQLAGKC
jgi:hypothetical protein